MPNLYVFGDSMSEDNAIVPSADLWSNRLATYTGLTLQNFAKGGHIMADQAWWPVPSPTSGINPALGNIHCIMAGANDAYLFGNAASLREQCFVPATRALAGWFCHPAKNYARWMSRSGAWAICPWTDVGMISTTAGDKIWQNTDVSGEFVYIYGPNYMNADAEVKCDGVVIGTLEQRGSSSAPIMTGRVGVIPGAKPFGYGAWRFATGSPGPHAIEITNLLNGPTLSIDAIVGSDQPTSPRVTIATVPRRGLLGYGNGNSDSNVATYSDCISDIAGELVTEGANIRVVPVNTTIHPAIHLLPDNLHIDASGHRELRRLHVDAALN